VDFLIHHLGGIGGGSDVWKIVILGVHHWRRRDICSAAEASSFGQELSQGEMFDY
jgi:hypothetical protein